MRKEKMVAIVIFMAFLFLPGLLRAEVFHVSSQSEFQNALNTAASNGRDDVIYVEADINIAGTPLWFQFVPTADNETGHTLTIEGQGHVLDGRGSVQIMKIITSALNNDTGSDITIRNLTFQNGYSTIDGGGLYVWTEAADITIENCTFSNNTSDNRTGGGAWIGTDSGTPKLINNTFNNNSARYGGGAYVGTDSGTAILTNNTFNSNSAQIEGGGVYVQAYHNSAIAKLISNTFNDNYARYSGGGAYVRAYRDSTTAILENNIFSGNSADEQGGGACVTAISGIAKLINNIFSGNSAQYGGGVFVKPESGTAILTNNTLWGNSADFGGGACVRTYYDNATANIYNNIIWGNTVSVTGYGDDLYIDSDMDRNNTGSTINLYNNDLGSNSDFETGQSEDLYIFNTDNYHHDGNIKEDPKLVDPANGDFHLQAGSPCIDAGDNDAPGLSLVSTDFEGDPRIIDGDQDNNPVVDMGADEYRSPEQVFYTLSVNKSGTGSGAVVSNPPGINCGETCSAQFENATSVTLTATVDEGSTFAGWTGDCGACGQNAQCEITMNSDKQCTATFNQSGGQDDGDGVDASVEDGAPNGGDGNGDGVLDSLQGHVTSLPSATGRGYITVELLEGCSQNKNVRTQTENPDDPNYTYPFGLVSFELPCNSARIRVYFHGSNDLRGFLYRKYGPITPGDPATTTWYTLSGVTFGTANIGGHTVAYVEFTLTDGQKGDDTGVDGRIVDQGGPAQPVPVMAVPTLTEWGIIVFTMLAGFVAAYYLRKDQLS